jgi:hypothetical protein
MSYTHPWNGQLNVRATWPRSWTKLVPRCRHAFTYACAPPSIPRTTTIGMPPDSKVTTSPGSAMSTLRQARTGSVRNTVAHSRS